MTCNVQQRITPIPDTGLSGLPNLRPSTEFDWRNLMDIGDEEPIKYIAHL